MSSNALSQMNKPLLISILVINKIFPSPNNSSKESCLRDWRFTGRNALDSFWRLKPELLNERTTRWIARGSMEIVRMEGGPMFYGESEGEWEL
jgi:hypothetical protein